MNKITIHMNEFPTIPHAQVLIMELKRNAEFHNQKLDGVYFKTSSKYINGGYFKKGNFFGVDVFFEKPFPYREITLVKRTNEERIIHMLEQIIIKLEVIDHNVKEEL